MEYKGRIFTIITMTILCSFFLFYHFLEDDHIPLYELLASLFFIGLSWTVGQQYDIANQQKKVLQKFAQAMDSSIDGMAILNSNGEFEYINQAHSEIYGYKKRELLNKSWMILYDNKELNRIKTEFGPIIQEHGKWSGELFGKKKDGTLFPQHLSLSVISETNQMICIIRDITLEKEAEAKIRHMAYHDMLTGLPNRYTFNEHLENAISRCNQNQQSLAIIFIDLDRFKFINDTLGHNLGDIMLIEVSKRLVASVRDGDIVARQGGDEFTLLIENTQESEVKEIAERILHSFTIPFVLEKEEFYTSPSIGISMYPSDGKDGQALTKHADTAMYLAKNRGKNNYQFYIQEDKDILERKMKLEKGLKRALVNKELELYYQPKIDLKNGSVYGVEALLRWLHPEFGIVPPAEFIPIAEQTGMIIPIGVWVIHQASKQNKLWQKNGFWIKMSVNVSSIQFEDKRFVTIVKDTLTNNQLDPHYFSIEITESVMQNIKHSSAIIHELKKLGVKVSIDDFGTGYSSLSVLNSLPIDTVKIDRSFINEITNNSNTASLVKTMIEMGETLKFDLVAEGIETEQQSRFLNENGCHYGQGYYYSPPLPVSEIEIYFKKRNLGTVPDFS